MPLHKKKHLVSFSVFGRRLAAAGGLLLAGVALSRAQEQPPAPPPLPATPVRRNTLFDIDLRYRNANRETRGSYVDALRVTADLVRVSPLAPGDVRGGARAQLLLENDDRGTSLNRLRVGEAFGFYRFALPGVSATLKAGQIVLPFGLAAQYDPLQPIQPLYDKGLGLRIDTGLFLEGDYGPYRYAGAITFGTGPNRGDPDSNKMISFRLERSVETRLGRVTVGGSLLTGRAPVTNFATVVPASGTTNAGQFVDKTRFAGDGQYAYGPFTLRGEFAFGGDDEDAVWGYFGEGNYRWGSGRATLVGFRKRWNFPQKPQSATTTGVGVNYTVKNGLILRALYEYERDVPSEEAGGAPFIIKRITLQTRLSF